jgi:hypothetical protein
MLIKRLKHLGSFILLSGLVACYGVGKVYIVISESFILKDNSVVTKTFSLPTLGNSKSVDLFFAFSSSDTNTGRFSINNHTFVEFEVLKDDIPPGSIDTIFNLPRSWFKKDNVIVFEHLSGEGIEVGPAELEFNEFQTSPYED